MTEEKSTTAVTPDKAAKPTIASLFEQFDDEAGEADLLAKVIGADGKLKVDTSTPESFELDIMASMMVEHLVSFKQTQRAWKAARNLGDNARAKQLFEQWKFNQLTIALIQADFPGAKALADTMMAVRAEVAGKQRDAALSQKE